MELAAEAAGEGHTWEWGKDEEQLLHLETFLLFIKMEIVDLIKYRILCAACVFNIGNK